MTKYSFVLLTKELDAFLAELQSAGVVDISSSEYEATDYQRNLLASVERYGAVIERNKVLRKSENFVAVEPYRNGTEALESYNKATAELAQLNADILQCNKELYEAELWGAFSQERVAKLSEAGIKIRLYSAYTNDYQRIEEGDVIVEPVAERDGQIYFVVIGDTVLDAQEHKLPERTITEIRAQIIEIEQSVKEQNRILAKVASSDEQLQQQRAELVNNFSFSKAQTVAQSVVQDSVVIVEGFAPTTTELPEFEGVYVLKSEPTADDDVPVKLKMGRFWDAFQFVGDFYALPKYGTTDLTPYFSLFYMLFFGFCMGDAGYGAILVTGYFVLRKRKSMARVARLTLYCGLMSIVFGLLTGSVFGMSLSGWSPLADIKGYFLTGDMLFYMAVGLGVVQIIFGIILNIAGITRRQGFGYSLGRVGWLIVMISTGVAYALGAMSSVWYTVALCTGLAGMLLLNNPKRNPLVNIGSGLWNTYNDLTGLLGDVLSYIRLFALCLSGGTLAVVFNDLVMGITGSLPLLAGIPIAIVLLAFLHAINIFMAVIGSFVHPMRLTFVEFYKNAGFEPATRAYEPFKKSEQ